MKFVIRADGAPPTDVADKFWESIKKYGVNFLVLDESCYLYGEADESTVAKMLYVVSRWGFRVELERG